MQTLLSNYYRVGNFPKKIQKPNICFFSFWNYIKYIRSYHIQNSLNYFFSNLVYKCYFELKKDNKTKIHNHLDIIVPNAVRLPYRIFIHTNFNIKQFTHAVICNNKNNISHSNKWEHCKLFPIYMNQNKTYNPPTKTPFTHQSALSQSSHYIVLAFHWVYVRICEYTCEMYSQAVHRKHIVVGILLVG